jgi:hypothetical protein
MTTLLVLARNNFVTVLLGKELLWSLIQFRYFQGICKFLSVIWGSSNCTAIAHDYLILNPCIFVCHDSCYIPTPCPINTKVPGSHCWFPSMHRGYKLYPISSPHSLSFTLLSFLQRQHQAKPNILHRLWLSQLGLVHVMACCIQ